MKINSTCVADWLPCREYFTEFSFDSFLSVFWTYCHASSKWPSNQLMAANSGVTKDQKTKWLVLKTIVGLWSLNVKYFSVWRHHYELLAHRRHNPCKVCTPWRVITGTSPSIDSLRVLARLLNSSGLKLGLNYLLMLKFLLPTRCCSRPCIKLHSMVVE